VLKDIDDYLTLEWKSAGKFNTAIPKSGGNKMIKVVSKAKLKQGVNIEEYLTIAKKVIDETRKEQGCISYVLFQDLQDPSILTMLEEWMDEAAINQHDQSDHVLTLVPELRKMRESTETHRYRELY
jgi:quinol monooxygenase YgiN